MKLQFNEKYRLYTYVAGASVVSCILAGRFELLLIGLPFFLAVLLPGLTRLRSKFTISSSISPLRCIEGDTITVDVHIHAFTAVPLLEVRHLLMLRDGKVKDLGGLVVTLAPGEHKTVSFRVSMEQRGIFRLGQIKCRALDAAGLIWSNHQTLPGRTVRVLPRISRLDLRGSAAAKVGLYTGNYLSKLAGDGIDLAEIRQYRQGDAARQINWRASLKWGNLFINEHNQERNTDVIIIVDILREIGKWPYTSLECSARGAASIAHHFLHRKDRVGLIEYGGIVRWVRPASGKRQLYRIMNRLAEMNESTSLVSREIGTLPLRILPPGATVIVFSILLDKRSITMAASLGLRGYRPILVYLSPLTLLNELIGSTEADKLAQLWWQMEEKRKLRELRHAGTTVVPWDGRSSLDAALSSALIQRRQNRGQRTAGPGGERR